MSAQKIIANRFVIHDEKDVLGRGGMGVVYRATDTHTGETVAVKALKSDLVNSRPEIVDRFRREGEALRRLNHPNIVKMLGSVEEEDHHYLIIEYVQGGSLRDLLDEQGPLPLPQVIRIGLELVDALTRAHKLEIIHRDLKPANILLAADGTARLTDFGIAQLAAGPPLTLTGVIMGTLHYLSPEACNSEKLDARTDIWALGIILYEMLTGILPFTGETLNHIVLSILNKPVPDIFQYRPDVDPALAALVYGMLTKEREKRIPSVRRIGALLEEIMLGPGELQEDTILWPPAGHIAPPGIEPDAAQESPAVIQPEKPRPPDTSHSSAQAVLSGSEYPVVISQSSWWETQEPIRRERLRIDPIRPDEAKTIEILEPAPARSFHVYFNEEGDLTVQIWEGMDEEEIDSDSLSEIYTLDAQGSAWTFMKYLPTQIITFDTLPESEVSFDSKIVREAILIKRERALYRPEYYVLVVAV